MSVLNREAILGVSLKRVEVDVPAWGGSVFVRELRARDRLAAYALKKEDEDVPNERIMLSHIVHSVVDENGELIFQDTEADRDFIFNSTLETFNLLSSTIAELNHFESVEEEEEVNFPTTPNESSASD